jgi:hypothetical protein
VSDCFLHAWYCWQAPWYINGQLGGRVTVYDGLTFTTVRNAGHMVRECSHGNETYHHLTARNANLFCIGVASLSDGRVQVPQTQPDRALHMVKQWIQGKPF